MTSFAIFLTALTNALQLSPRLLYTLALLLVPSSLILLSRIIGNAVTDFRTKDGRKMVVLKQDTRVSRFTHGPALSQEGKRLAGIDPYLVRNGGNLEVVIHSPEHVRDFFAKDGKDHLKPPNANFGVYFGRMLGECVGMLNGSVWDKAKVHLIPHFAHGAAMAAVPMFKAEYLRWVEKLPEDKLVSYKRSDGSGFVIDALSACRKLPFKLIAMVLYRDMLTDKLFDELWELNEVHERITYAALLRDLPAKKWYSFLPTRDNKLLEAYLKDWARLNMAVINEARVTGTYCPVTEMYKGVENGDMTLEQFLQSLDEILFTNVDVTSSIFAYVLINLARDREFQSALRQEILSYSHGLDAYITDDEALLHFAYLEALRVNPASWFSIPETTGPDPKYIGSFLIPPHTSVIIDLKILNTQSPIWGSDGHIFRPLRWRGMSPSAVRYSFHRYGMGPRKCMGKNVANILIKMLMVTLLEKYEVVADAEEGEGKYRTDRFTRAPEKEVEFRVLLGKGGGQ
ncbi:cytochrome P450 [Terfezia boudieri ATCC MYA-4762]|uniref:Cytochrome P450 n=1 Tax=Terfezia boudieri ATCC MYA-4762 TaxID=1051890 RepID=A0A3N4M2E6_9PEZI|nr:cytochrome P450 [Terfezia boudieri ATCC MYA-4762]